MKFDDILSYLGQFGPWQRQKYFLLCIPSISVGMQLLGSVFLLAIPDHRCVVPGMSNDTYATQGPSHKLAINLTIPPGQDDLKYDQCYVYDVVTEPSDEGGVLYSFNGTGSTRKRTCGEWVYDHSTFTSTLISKFDLVCERKLSKSHAQMFIMLGSMVGVLVVGPPADYFGRKKLMVITAILHVIASFAVALSPTFVFLCAFLFLNGASVTALYTVVFVMGMELVGPKRRSVAGFIIVIFFAGGVVMESGLAYFIRNWQHLQFAISSISVFFLAYYWLIPESPRWLVSQERYEEAEVILRSAAKYSKVTIPDKAFEWDSSSNKEDEKVHEPMWHIIKYPRLIIRTLVIYYIWLVCSMTYYGLGLNVGDLAGSIFLNSCLYGLVEILSYVCCLFLLDRIGRKPLTIAGMLIAGVTCTGSPFPVVYGGPSLHWLSIVLAILGKFGVSAAFAIIWLYSCELFPTVIRSSGVASSSILARIGGVISPYIANMSVTITGPAGQILPLVIFGVLSLIGAVLTLVLPETNKSKLPETLKDANEFGKVVQPVEAKHPSELEDLNPERNSHNKHGNDIGV